MEILNLASYSNLKILDENEIKHNVCGAVIGNHRPLI